MAEFPSGVYAPRTIANRPGVVYDPADTKTLFAEDIDNTNDEVVAIETELGVDPKGSHDSVADRLADIEANFLKNPYKCRVYRNGTQSISSGQVTKVNMDTENYDPNGNYDNVTNYRYIAPVAGYYAITVHITLTTGAAHRFGAYIYVGGAMVVEAFTSPAVATNNYAVAHTVVHLDAGTVVEPKMYHNGSDAKNTVGGSGDTFMDIHLLSID